MTDKLGANQRTSCTAVALRVTCWLPLLPGHVVGHLMMRSPQMVCWPASWVPLERRPSR
jgi:hypothetical protein